MKYLLCLSCRRAWIGSVASSCCGERPLDVNPFSADRRAWFQARVRDRVDELLIAQYQSGAAHRRSLAKGARAKGNVWARAV